MPNQAAQQIPWYTGVWRWFARLKVDPSACVTAIATLVIAAFTAELYRVSNRQWQTMQRQLEWSERPWVTIDNVTLEPLNWETLRAPRFLGKPELRTFVNLHAKISYELNDTGKAPAVKTFSEAQVAYSSDWSTKTFTKPLGAMEITCAGPESDSRQAGTTNKQFSEGSIVFPGRPLHQPVESISGLPENVKIIDHIWIVACVVYQDGITPKIHHTRLWFRSNAKDPTMKHYEPVVSGQSIMWMPPAGFALVDSNAD